MTESPPVPHGSAFVTIPAQVRKVTGTVARGRAAPSIVAAMPRLAGEAFIPAGRVPPVAPQAASFHVGAPGCGERQRVSGRGTRQHDRIPRFPGWLRCPAGRAGTAGLLPEDHDFPPSGW